MIVTALLGNALKVEFLGFGDKHPDAFDIPKPMFVGLAYAVFISSGKLLVETAGRFPVASDLTRRCV